MPSFVFIPRVSKLDPIQPSLFSTLAVMETRDNIGRTVHLFVRNFQDYD